MRTHSEKAPVRVHELDKVPAGDEGGGYLEASRIGMLLYSCIWGDDQPPESRPTHLVRSARCGVEEPTCWKGPDTGEWDGLDTSFAASLGCASRASGNAAL